jgi:outer membrane protein OmpA-like peptidoglycan-associated protein
MTLKNLTIKGPELSNGQLLWQAENAEIVEWSDAEHLALETEDPAFGGHFADTHAIRNLFVTRKEILHKEKRKFLLPGTIVALCRIHKVDVNVGAIFTWGKRNNKDRVCHALLLLQTNPADWLKGVLVGGPLTMPNCVCIGGEIDLSMLQPPATDISKRIEALTKNRISAVKNPRLNATGLLFEGDCSFEWKPAQKISAPFLLAPFVETQTTGSFYLAIDNELVRAEREKWRSSVIKFQEVFSDLATSLKPVEKDLPAVYWTSLEPVNPKATPAFYWRIPFTTGTGTTLHFPPGEWQVVIADQSSSASNITPRGFLTLAPQIAINPSDGQHIIIEFKHAVPGAGDKVPEIVFNASRSGTDWTETISISNVTTQYEPLTTATLLREQYQLLAPEDDTVADPSILWGCMPLSNGWAQLPFLNLVESHYFNALRREFGSDPEPEQRNQSPLFSGAATFGNDAPQLFDVNAAENPWNISVLNATGYEGRWKIDAATAQLTGRNLKIFDPQIVLNGFLRLGVQSPSAKDVLPGLDNFLGELAKISLSTTRANDRFPSPFHLRFDTIKFKNKKAQKNGDTFSTAVLEEWSFNFHVNNNGDVFKKLLQEGVWNNSKDEASFQSIWKHLPLAWCRHPYAPLVQCLPLTQMQMPPAYPSASRQMAPFEFSVTQDSGLENSFGVDAATGAKDWPAWLGLPRARASVDWPGNLGLASLGLPGLVFDPQTPQNLLSKQPGFTGAQLLYSLPYTEEINALAQLPKEEKKESSNQPQTLVEKPILIPRRETYAAHWQQLSEKAVLAKADADEALELKAGKTTVINLVEPFAWTVTAQLELENYPGTITLANSPEGSVAPLVLTKESALKGISGKFVIQSNRLKHVRESEPGISITAGTMAAFADGQRLRDQRGWWRGATTADATSTLIKTPLERQSDQNEMFTLCTLRTPVTLTFANGTTWQCWFRDLPFKNDVFNRNITAAGAEDINDPNAVSAQKNALLGYEWRLAQYVDQPLDLLGFYFFPLTLENVVLRANEVQSVEIIGSVQLPFAQYQEQLPESGNAVRVKFLREGQSLKIQSIGAVTDDQEEPGTTNGIWNLDPEKQMFSPRLHWSALEYTAASNKIAMASLLEFYLFGERWEVPLSGSDFEPGKPAEFKGKVQQDESIGMQVVLQFNAQMLPAAINISLRCNWGNDASLKAIATIGFDLLQTQLRGNAINLLTHGITTTLAWNVADQFHLKIIKAWLDNRSLQLSFAGFNNNTDTGLEVLPGMLLDNDSGNPCAGFATAFFSIKKNDDGRKFFELNHGCMEAVFNCRWGVGPLAQNAVEHPASAGTRRVFQSSSGNVTAGYTLNYAAKKWTSSFLFNGMIEVNNLVSYPVSTLKNDTQLPVILFDSESDVVKPAEEERLRAVATEMKNNRALHLSIEGHTDYTDTARDNFKLSRRRAESVKSKLKSLLKALGVSDAEAEKRLTTAWFGETLPEASNLTPEGRALNRRVELHCLSTELPALRPATGSGSFNHIRHSLRILLNQHEIDSSVLATGSGSVLFKFKDNAAWQFLAVTEHRLTDVSFESLSEPIQQGNDRRWTTVQEIRFTSPAKFAGYINYFLNKDSGPDRKIFSAFAGSPFKKSNEDADNPQETLSIEPHEFSRISAAFHYKPFIEKLLTETGGQNEITKLGNAILVEASAIQKILNKPNSSNDPVNLQYLPGGVQQGILSVLDDFTMPEIEQGKSRADWALLSLPFLGRLQTAVNDWTGDAVEPPSPSLLAVDPILYLFKKRNNAQALPIVPLVLASRGDRTPVPIQVSLFDLTRFRRFNRLDPATLMESWFRIQHPPAEARDNQKKLMSVTAALPADSPSRLSRETMLQRLFHEQRNSFPPSFHELLNEDPPPTDDLTWRREALITWQGFSNIIKEDLSEWQDPTPSNNPYSFYFAAAQVHSYRFAANGNNVSRYPAVTLLPAHLQVNGSANKLPVSFAVSPYLGLEFKLFEGLVNEQTPVLVFAELLCLDATGSSIIPAGSRIWQQEQISGDGHVLVESWARELRNRVAMDSAVAVVRIRRVFSSDEEVTVRFPEIEYAFDVLASDEPPALLVESGGPLRLPLSQLRFAEGQFGGTTAPNAPELFEIAPPQVNGVQPIYIDKEKWNTHNQNSKWNWGLSALRMSVQLTDKNKGVIGSVPQQQQRLWWNAASHQVQFEDFKEAAVPKKFLPAKFRARCIDSLLPVPARPPLPGNFKDLPKEAGPVTAWQPVLPGALNYLFTGARPGVPFVFRHMLMRQELTANGENNHGSVPLVAAGVAVQHRFPRPVVLPANPALSELKTPLPVNALQTWAWHFEPQTTVKHLVTTNDDEIGIAIPHDNALVVDVKNVHGLEVSLPGLVDGILPESHDGRFMLQLRFFGHPAPPDNSNWQIKVELVTPGRHLSLVLDNEGFYTPDANAEPKAKPIEKFRQFLSDLPHGAAIQLRVIAIPAKEIVDNIEDYSQTLNFPLRLAHANRLRDAFRYHYAQFEDPEYNRRLVSRAAQANSEIVYKSGTISKKAEIILAVDRREYNATSEGTLAVFFAEQVRVTGKVIFKWMTSSGEISNVFLQDVEADSSLVLKFSLKQMQVEKKVQFLPGDSLLIVLDEITIAGSAGRPQALAVRVEIVKAPVTPVPEAAYALLRKKNGAAPVECVKFAWSPQPSRIELLTPADLKSGLVRRRAIFQWIDTARLGSAYSYEVQKITASGSTHFDLFGG